jgi:hypothetical protein
MSGGDHTRFSFKPVQDHSLILNQAGRVMLDADFNRMVEAFDRRWRAETLDIIGRCTVPKQTPHGFEIAVAAGPALTIGPGRLYADGLLAENHGAAPPVFDTALGEQPGSALVPYDQQPYLPDAANFAPLPAGGGPYLAYLDTWRREVTYLQEADLVEKAIGIDTITTMQTAWQVRVLTAPGGKGIDGLACDTPDKDIPGWLDLTAPSAGRLTTAAAGTPTSDDPCEIPPDGGYRGAENRLYRVEIHDPGAMGVATFKWSRDDASVGTNITAMNAGRDQLTVARVGRDAYLRFNSDDWVEVTDDWHELHGVAGEMRQVLAVDDVNRVVTLKAALPASAFDPTKPERHMRMIRWDQKSQVFDSNGNLYADVDAAGGLIKVPPAGPPVTLVLENGVQVTFSADPAGGAFKAFDYWAFAARTVDASVEQLQAAPPRGVLHHFCRLAVITFPNSVQDCRTLWPPDFGGVSCDCSVCVSADEHNSNHFTIQMAINQVVKMGGGKVCLGPGIYLIRDTIQIHNAQSIQLRGQGWRTILVNQTRGALTVDLLNSLGVTVDELSVLFPVRSLEGSLSAGIGVRNSASVRIEHCALIQALTDHISGAVLLEQPVAARMALYGGPAIALGGFIAQTSIRDNLILATFGVLSVAGLPFVGGGMAAAAEVAAGEFAGRAFGYLISANLFIDDNVILSSYSGVSLEGLTYLMADTRISGNTLVGGTRAGAAVTGRTLPLVSRVDVTRNLVMATGTGIAIGTDGARVGENDMWPIAEAAGDGIAVVPGTSRLPAQLLVIAGNRVSGFIGNAIGIQAPVGSAEITGNLISGTGSGIVMGDKTQAADVRVAGNQLRGLSPGVKEPPAVYAIRLFRAQNAQVTSNLIDGVARDVLRVAGCFGIQAVACGLLTIEGNHVIGVGNSAGFNGQGAGIDVVLPFDAVKAHHNVVSRTGSPPAADLANWWGVRIGFVEAVNYRYWAPPGLLPFVISPGIVFPFVQARELVTVTDNTIDAAGVQSALLVETNGSCVAGHNHCRLASQRAVSPAVNLYASSIILDGNNVQGPGEPQPSVLLNPTSKRFTAYGNVTSASILLAPNAPLPPPWRRLNVFGP